MDATTKGTFSLTGETLPNPRAQTDLRNRKGGDKAGSGGDNSGDSGDEDSGAGGVELTELSMGGLSAADELSGGVGLGEESVGDDLGDNEDRASIKETEASTREKALFKWLVPLVSMSLFVAISLLIMIPIDVVVYQPIYAAALAANASSSSSSSSGF